MAMVWHLLILHAFRDKGMMDKPELIGELRWYRLRLPDLERRA